MYFIGSGALLWQALNYCVLNRLPIDGVCCPKGDRIVPRYKKVCNNVVISDNPNAVMDNVVETTRDGVVFSVNNKHILSDEMLLSSLQFYNIHNGLVQSYRGIAEVCVFAAICQGAKEYGATLQRLLPGEVVDGGAAVAQISTTISESDTFELVFEKSLILCTEIFKLNVSKILRGSAEFSDVAISSSAYSYKHIPNLVRGVPHKRLSNARSMGNYSGLLPRLKEAIDHSCSK